MTKPERVGMEMVDRICHHVLYSRPDGKFTPGVSCKRTMTTEDNHDLTVPWARSIMFFTRGMQDRTIKRNVSKNVTRGKRTAPFDATAGIATLPAYPVSAASGVYLQSRGVACVGLT